MDCARLGVKNLILVSRLLGFEEWGVESGSFQEMPVLLEKKEDCVAFAGSLVSRPADRVSLCPLCSKALSPMADSLFWWFSFLALWMNGDGSIRSVSDIKKFKLQVHFLRYIDVK